MTKTIFFRSSLFLLLLISLAACNGQQETGSFKVPPQTSTPEATETKSQDFDPYFKASAATKSKYGPTSITRNIMQDRNGDIWLATWEGIIRYDGKTFTNFTNKNYLRKFHVFSTLEDMDGHLWFGTIGAGVYRYDGVNFINITQKNGLAYDQQGCFYQDRSGKIWIGTMEGISIYNGKSYRNITTNDGLPDNDINSIVEDRSGKIWIASRGALCTYDGLTFTLVRKDKDQLMPDVADKNVGNFYNVRTVIEDLKGNVWFGGNDGFWRHDTNGKFTQIAKEFTGYIYEDREGNIWTSSAVSGKPDEWQLSRYAAECLDGATAAPTVILQRKDMFFGITEDADGGIWLGSLNGVGRYDGKDFDWFRAE
jgi:ligand-binding sensor domain-containing protein